MKLTVKKFQNAVDASKGWCTHCRKFTRDSTEPDAEGYDCPKCNNNTVMGAENALIVGMITL